MRELKLTEMEVVSGGSRIGIYDGWSDSVGGSRVQMDGGGVGGGSGTGGIDTSAPGGERPSVAEDNESGTGESTSSQESTDDEIVVTGTKRVDFDDANIAEMLAQYTAALALEAGDSIDEDEDEVMSVEKMQEIADEVGTDIETALTLALENDFKYVNIAGTIFDIEEVLGAVSSLGKSIDAATLVYYLAKGDGESALELVADTLIAAGVTAILTPVVGPGLALLTGQAAAGVIDSSNLVLSVVQAPGNAYEAAEEGFLWFYDEMKDCLRSGGMLRCDN